MVVVPSDCRPKKKFVTALINFTDVIGKCNKENRAFVKRKSTEQKAAPQDCAQAHGASAEVK